MALGGRGAWTPSLTAGRLLIQPLKSLPRLFPLRVAVAGPPASRLPPLPFLSLPHDTGLSSAYRWFLGPSHSAAGRSPLVPWLRMDTAMDLTSRLHLEGGSVALKSPSRSVTWPHHSAWGICILKDVSLAQVAWCLTESQEATAGTWGGSLLWAQGPQGQHPAAGTALACEHLPCQGTWDLGLPKRGGDEAGQRAAADMAVKAEGPLDTARQLLSPATQMLPPAAGEGDTAAGGHSPNLCPHSGRLPEVAAEELWRRSGPTHQQSQARHVRAQASAPPVDGPQGQRGPLGALLHGGHGGAPQSWAGDWTVWGLQEGEARAPGSTSGPQSASSEAKTTWAAL